MAKNKVVFGDTVIMDITDTTAEASDVASGEVFYDRSGVRQVGTGNYMDKVSSPTANDILVTDANGQAIDSGVQISSKMDLVSNPVNNALVVSDSNGQVQITSTDIDQLLNDVEAGKEAFMLKDFTQQVNITIPHCNQDIANTSIPNMDIDLNEIDPTGELNQKYAIASLMKYEVYDATSGCNRLNCCPVCSFSMNSQRTLRLRMMCAGSTGKTARRIAGALLLKHR